MSLKDLIKREKELIRREQNIAKRLNQERQRAFDRFPLLFTLLGTFGLVATFYGFERVIDTIEPLAENPYTLLAAGIVTLILTGSLYRKLQ